MSGDVQPRKRKEKRRKKDDEDTGTPPPTLVNAAETLADNVTIHIYKESSTGGHWCARIVFFVLLAVLVGLIGIIIFEHRGTTDVDTPLESSRWAFVFDGWVDDLPPSHNEEPPGEEEHGSEEGEGEEEDHGEEAESANAEASKEETEHGEEEDEGIGDDEEESEAADESAEEEDETAQDEEEYVSTELNNQREDEGIEEDEGDEDVSQEDFDDAGVLEEVNAASEEGNEEDDTVDEADDRVDLSTEADEMSEEQNNYHGFEEFISIPGVNEIDDDSAEPLEEVEGIEPEEDVQDTEIEPEVEEIEEESASVPVKFGVGVALVVAAHFVLVRRWNNVELDGLDATGTPDLSRRNTIVPPPHIKRVNSSNEKEEQIRTKKQTQNYEELRSKYNKLEVDNPADKILPEKSLSSKSDRTEMKNIWSGKSPTKKEETSVRGQSKVISSEEEEEDGEELETSEGERISGVEDYEEEEEEEDEEEEEEEMEEEEEEEIETVDDSELIAKLEAKYGKLPSPQVSEEEDEEDEEQEEEEDEEEMEEDEDIAGWKRVKSPKDTPAQSGSATKSVHKSEIKTEHGDAVKNKGGARAYDFNLSSTEDIVIREENNS